MRLAERWHGVNEHPGERSGVIICSRFKIDMIQKSLQFFWGIYKRVASKVAIINNLSSLSAGSARRWNWESMTWPKNLMRRAGLWILWFLISNFSDNKTTIENVFASSRFDNDFANHEKIVEIWNNLEFQCFTISEMASQKRWKMAGPPEWPKQRKLSTNVLLLWKNVQRNPCSSRCSEKTGRDRWAASTSTTAKTTVVSLQTKSHQLTEIKNFWAQWKS